MTAPLEAIAAAIERARYVVALTGAGVSTESGIPDFRSDEGLWKDADPMEVSSIDGFREDPARFYRFWRGALRPLQNAPPSKAHELLAYLESRGRVQAVITQNVDGLHQRAGSRSVLEVHGTFQRVRCLECGHELRIDAVLEGEGVPACPACGALRLKPDVVLFGEMLPPVFSQAESEVRQADLLLVLGTSLTVFPVAGLVPLAAQTGAEVVLLNRDRTPYDDDATLVAHGELGAMCGELLNLL